MSEALQGTGIRTTRTGMMDEYGGFIPGSYLANPHRDDELDAVVTKDGSPIMANGEVLTIGICPGQFRWAIGDVVDGQAEVLEQHIFKDRLMSVDQEYYAFQNQRYDKDPNLIPIPLVERYVARKRDPMEGKIVELGWGRKSVVQTEPDKLYSPATDTLVDRAQIEADEKAREAGLADTSAKDALLKKQVETITELRQQIEEMREFQQKIGEVAQNTEPIETNQAAAPCGAMVNAKKIYAHARFCKKDPCIKYNEELKRDREARKASEAKEE